MMDSYYSESSGGGGPANSYYHSAEDEVYYDAAPSEQQFQQQQQPMPNLAPSETASGGGSRTDVLKLILYDLNSAIAPRDIRMLSIHTALEEFDHDDELLHDEELELRADHILLQKLTYALSLNPSSIEVGYICSAMECVYRAGRGRLGQSFHEICDALLPLFVEMVHPPPGYSPVQAAAEAREGMRRMSEGLSVDEKNVEGGSVEGGAGRDDNLLHMSQGPQPEAAQDSAAQQTYYGDYDEESAESVEIPSGTGEYFDTMNRMQADSAQTDNGVAPSSGTDNGDFVRDQSERSMGSKSHMIPPGTGEYMEEMKRRVSANEEGAPHTDFGQGDVMDKAMVPDSTSYGTAGAEDGTEQALVLHYPAFVEGGG